MRLIKTAKQDIIFTIAEVMKMAEARKFLKDMGYRISTKRKALGLTQENLAELADISPQLISNAENGERAISCDKLYRISKALKTSADYLLSGEKTDVDKSFELYELSEKLKNASPEQLEKINQMIDVIKN